MTTSSTALCVAEIRIFEAQVIIDRADLGQERFAVDHGKLARFQQPPESRRAEMIDVRIARESDGLLVQDADRQAVHVGNQDQKDAVGREQAADRLQEGPRLDDVLQDRPQRHALISAGG